jgi:hypothetical protein
MEKMTPNSACYQCSEQSFYARLNISSLVLSRINPDMTIGFDGMKLGVEMRCPRHSEDSGSKMTVPLGIINEVENLNSP